MADTELIVAAIEGVQKQVETLQTGVNKVLEDHEQRLRGAERSILKFKTLGSAVTTIGGFLGWDVLKHHVFKS